MSTSHQGVGERPWKLKLCSYFADQVIGQHLLEVFRTRETLHLPCSWLCCRKWLKEESGLSSWEGMWRKSVSMHPQQNLGSPQSWGPLGFVVQLSLGCGIQWVCGIHRTGLLSWLGSAEHGRAPRRGLFGIWPPLFSMPLAVRFDGGTWWDRGSWQSGSSQQLAQPHMGRVYLYWSLLACLLPGNIVN